MSQNALNPPLWTFPTTGLRDRLEGVGVPPVRDLLAKARQHNVPIYV